MILLTRAKLEDFLGLGRPVTSTSGPPMFLEIGNERPSRRIGYARLACPGGDEAHKLRHIAHSAD